MSDIITRDDNGDLAVRTVTATEDATVSEYDDLYARTTDGKRALRVVGAGGGTGGGDVSSVNGKKGAVVLTGADINSTLTGTGDPVTATITDHLQTLKNDESELGNQVSKIQELIPSDASTTNLLATKADVGGGLPDQTGHTGFLQTDGTNASWSDKPAIVNNALSPDYQIAIGKNATTKKGLSDPIAIGTGAQATQAWAIAIGHNARATALGAIQIAASGISDAYAERTTNSEEYTFKVALPGQGLDVPFNYTLLRGDGFIPSERLAADGTTGQVLSKTDTGMQWVNASGGATVTDNENGTKIIRIGKTVIITGTDSIGSVGAGVATEHPITLPVTMANNTYVVSLTPTCDGGFAQLNVDYEEETTTGFNVGLRNIGSTASSNVKIGWMVIGDIAE